MMMVEKQQQQKHNAKNAYATILLVTFDSTKRGEEKFVRFAKARVNECVEASNICGALQTASLIRHRHNS